MVKYHISSRLIHWIMALIIFGALGLGVYMTEFLAKDAANRMQIYGLHKSLGVMALIFIAIRIINLWVHPSPHLPETLGKIEKFLARLVKFLLYFLMITVPLSGYLMSNSYGYHVHLFAYKMPMIIEKNFGLATLFSNIHQICAYILIGTIFLHILGALKHKFFDKPENDVLKRMT